MVTHGDRVFRTSFVASRARFQWRLSACRKTLFYDTSAVVQGVDASRSISQRGGVVPHALLRAWGSRKKPESKLVNPIFHAHGCCSFSEFTAR